MDNTGSGHIYGGGGPREMAFDDLLASQSQGSGEKVINLTSQEMEKYLENEMSSVGNKPDEDMDADNTPDKGSSSNTEEITDHGFRNVYLNVIDFKGPDIRKSDPYALQEAMSKAISEYKACKPLKSGSLLVEVESFEQVKQLLAIEEFLKIKVKPKIANNIGSLKGVIFEPRIIHKDTNDLCERWKKFGVIQVDKNTTRDKDGNIVPTGMFTLTFKGETLPERIFIGDQSKRVTPWLRTVLQCKKCNRFNHFARTCLGN